MTTNQDHFLWDHPIIRTPGVAREQEYAERENYAENILTFDTRLLQDNGR